MTELTTVTLSGIVFAVFGAVGFGSLWFWLVLSRVDRNVIWEDDATIRGKVEVYYTHIKEREDLRYLVHNMIRGGLLGFLLGVFGAIFMYGLNEVLP